MKKGFTLIELLVVVLIIGILAAIALPQYTKAVEKSRLAEAQLITKNILDAMQRLQLAQPPAASISGKELIESLDIDLNSGTWDGVSYITKNFNYVFACSQYGCTIDTKRVRGEEELYQIETSISSTADVEDSICYTNKTTVGRGICKQLVSNGYTMEDAER
ncbi:prepilin-type N-terminal cleavage/methylation domain-containing protein [Elusimicrobium simillimum]|uniref:type IV pilin protein n=1 Tax=Elusimicrobium simillimum TaxID=3143438 RepID=UPI003C6FF7A2